MERIEKLRLVALEHYPRNDEFYYNFYKKYSADTRESEYEKYADAYYHALTNFTPHITDGELIVGESELLMSLTPLIHLTEYFCILMRFSILIKSNNRLF